MSKTRVSGTGSENDEHSGSVPVADWSGDSA